MNPPARNTFATRFTIVDDVAHACPPELVGTSCDPLTVDGPVSRKAIKAALAERKALRRKSMPLRVKTFEC